MTPFASVVLLLSMLFSGLLSGCSEREPQQRAVETPPPAVAVVRPDSHRDLETYFAEHEYRWTTIHEGVPPFILEHLPGDLHRVGPVKKKKRLFFLSLLPMVLMANEEVRQQRQTLLALLSRHDAGKPLTSGERAVIDSLARDYGMKSGPLDDLPARRELLRRIDIVPPSLVLAQAATESAYGTSRFAREGNNLFGQWTFVPGTGLVPKRRPPGATYEVRRYPNLYASLQSYLKNLNTHLAYRPLREQRAHLRAAEQPLRGHDLARGLLRYSERKEAYVRELRAIIRRNHLMRLSAAELRRPPRPESRRDEGIDRSRYGRNWKSNPPSPAA